MTAISRFRPVAPFDRSSFVNVRPIGFGNEAEPSSAAGPEQISRLHAALDLVTPATNPRTARLLASGLSKMAQKVMEEAGEVAMEAVRHRNRGVIRESADLVYNLVVLWRECGVDPSEIWTEMARRATILGLAEKLPKRASACAPHDDDPDSA
jgi:phosphoribosyl-ATP pyrophosphohydrolase